jgi:para-aminobenzoate synthetase component 1
LELKNILNSYGKEKKPFFFVISYDMSSYDIIPIEDISKDIRYAIDNNTISTNKINLQYSPITYDNYKSKFDNILENIKEGNTYLLNLTQQSQLDTNLSLDEIYDLAHARYKVKYKDQFVCFSPEKFIDIKNNKISTYPMKGTIDASIINAKEKILANAKEIAEHTMVVDLLRNDLSIVSKRVRVEKFRYCENIKAGTKELIQVSSEIYGDLENNWQKNIGDILTSLLPAGSITGTPKKKTIDLIKDIEDYDRKYFTGVCGVFDGESLESFVMIRFIEKLQNNKYIYKSGGGITYDSNCQDEYQEMCDKVYIP